MSKNDYSLALKFTAKTSEVARKVRGLGRNIDMNLSTSNSRALRGIGKLASGFGKVASAVIRVGGLIGGAFVGGLQAAFGLVGRIARGLSSLPMTALKLLAVGGVAVFGAHKALSPAGEMERYKTQLDVMGKSGLYNYLTQASAGKPFQMGESVQAGVLLEAFKISSRKHLSTVMDAAAGFKKPLEEIVRMLAYARSGRTGEAIESAGSIGITRGDLKKFGIRFEKSGAVTADTVGRLMDTMIKVMQTRFGGMANRIGTGTYEGAVSDLNDSVFRAFANAGKKFLPFATKIVRNVSKIVTSMSTRIAALPWDSWGAKLASGVEAAGNIIDNLFDPKRRTEIAKSIVDGWNNVKDDIPKLGKALVLDLVDVATNASAPKISKVFSSVIEASGKILGVLIADPLINLWNTVYTGLVTLAGKTYRSIIDIAHWIAKSISYLNIGPSRKQIDKNAKQLRERQKVAEAKQLLAGLVKTNTEATLEKWKRDMAGVGKTGKSMSRTKAVLSDIKQKSGVTDIIKKLTAPIAAGILKPIALSLLAPGRNSGYINGKAVPLSPEQLKGNETIKALARMLPDMFNIKKETDVFGREFQQFNLNFKADSDKNLNLNQLILQELKKLNKNLGG